VSFFQAHVGIHKDTGVTFDTVTVRRYCRQTLEAGKYRSFHFVVRFQKKRGFQRVARHNKGRSYGFTTNALPSSSRNILGNLSSHTVCVGRGNITCGFRNLTASVGQLRTQSLAALSELARRPAAHQLQRPAEKLAFLPSSSERAREVLLSSR
jgi:hypothetical protein